MPALQCRTRQMKVSDAHCLQIGMPMMADPIKAHNVPSNRRIACRLQGLSNLRGKAGGGKDQGIVVPPADGRNSSYPFANLVPQDGLGKAFQRTPDEVLPPVHMSQRMPAHAFIALTQQAHPLPPMHVLRCCCCWRPCHARMSRRVNLCCMY